MARPGRRTCGSRRTGGRCVAASRLQCSEKRPNCSANSASVSFSRRSTCNRRTGSQHMVASPYAAMPTAAPTVRRSCRSAARDACKDQNGNLPRNNAIIARQSRATTLVISKSSVRSMSQFAASCCAAISERIACASDIRHTLMASAETPRCVGRSGPAEGTTRPRRVPAAGK